MYLESWLIMIPYAIIIQKHFKVGKINTFRSQTFAIKNTLSELIAIIIFFCTIIKMNLK